VCGVVCVPRANERSIFFAKNIVNEMKEVEQNTETSAY